ncbi:MAG: hypothetical protein JWN04_6673 [Myxococcaceae bacterium]|nr:hypothetical protein [Myxococcaceae bacterium]
MTKTFCTLALLTSALAYSACSGEAPKDKPKAPSHAVTAPPAAPKATVEALTATAPARPLSIADAPTVQKKPELQQIEPFDFSHDEPEASIDEANELPDFDRALRADEVKVDRFVLATGVAEREPTGESDTFDTDTKRIFAFVQLENETAPYAVEVHFEKLDGPRSLYGVKLEVPTAERYRTWAWTQIRRAPGQYRAVLRTRQGEEIASRVFTIVAAPAR